MSDTDFGEVTSAIPEESWFGEVDLMDSWYDYDMSTHVLTPKDRVYLIQEVDADLTWKLQITTYYPPLATYTTRHFAGHCSPSSPLSSTHCPLYTVNKSIGVDTTPRENTA